MMGFCACGKMANPKTPGEVTVPVAGNLVTVKLDKATCNRCIGSYFGRMFGKQPKQSMSSRVRRPVFGDVSRKWVGRRG